MALRTAAIMVDLCPAGRGKTTLGRPGPIKNAQNKTPRLLAGALGNV